MARLSLACLAASVLLWLGGCAAPAVPDPGMQLDLGGVEIPSGSAHTVFQGGRQVSGASSLEPFCELEIETVLEQPQRVSPVRLRVTGVRQALLKDPTTRIPALLAGFGCSDPVFWETVWQLAPDRPSPVLWLRCIAPYFDCRIGGPLTPGQIQAVVGPTIRVSSASSAVPR
jgi:hypothetical protein